MVGVISQLATHRRSTLRVEFPPPSLDSPSRDSLRQSILHASNLTLPPATSTLNFMSRHRNRQRIARSRPLSSISCLLATLAMLFWPVLAPARCCCAVLQTDLQLQQLPVASIDAQTPSQESCSVSPAAAGTCPLCLAAPRKATSVHRAAPATDQASPRDEGCGPTVQALCHCSSTAPQTVTLAPPSESFKQALRISATVATFPSGITSLPAPLPPLTQCISRAPGQIPVKANPRLALLCSWLN